VATFWSGKISSQLLIEQSNTKSEISLATSSCYSIVGPIQKDMSVLNLYINGKVIQNVKWCKYLGILIDSDLKWQDHINYVYNKIIKFTSMFYKIRNKLPQEVLKMIYFAFVHTHLLYGIEVLHVTSLQITCLN